MGPFHFVLQKTWPFIGCKLKAFSSEPRDVGLLQEFPASRPNGPEKPASLPGARTMAALFDPDELQLTVTGCMVGADCLIW
jgi:hypothetical protein